MATLQLNPDKAEPIQLDKGSEQWLQVIRRNSGKNRPCAVPQHYFDVLKTWGLVQGTFGAAKISPTGLARLLEEERQEKQTPKTKKKKK